MQQHIGYKVKTLSRMIKRTIDADCADVGVNLSDMQRWIIHYIYKNPEEDVFQRDLEKMFGVRRSSATEQLKQLEELGLIVRVPVEYDARLKKIELTARAVSYKERVDCAIEATEERMVEGFSAEDRDKLLELLDKCKQNLDR